MSEGKKLPFGWETKKLGEIFLVSSGKGLKIDNFQAGRFPVYGGNGITGYHNEYFLEKERLIIGRVGVKCGVVHITKPQSWVTDNALIITPKIEQFCLKFFNFKLQYENLNKLSVSTAQPVISGSKIYGYEISIPPIEEQYQIVVKVEELFGELDKSIENLKAAQQQLRTYRQSVLKWAFEGRLTNNYVAENELPKNWKWVDSGSLFRFVTSGSRGWAKYYSEDGAIFLRITNLDFNTFNLDLREDKIQYVKPPAGSEGLRTKVEEGDFLFSITGYLGMLAIAPKLENAYVNQHIALCRPIDGFNKKYLGYWIISQSGGLLYLNNLRKGAVKAGLSLDDIKGFPVPMCPIAEQNAIVQEIEKRLSVCDKIEATITDSLRQAETLRQSILKKAFEGRLLHVREHTPLQLKTTNIEDDWQRKVLAGKIIFSYQKGGYIGRTKLQKLQYLCENFAQLDVKTNYIKEAAGPLDSDFLYGFIDEAKTKGWLEEEPIEKGYKYQPGSAISELTKEYVKYFRPTGQKINFVLNLLHHKSTDEAELIATIYAIWNNAIIRGEEIKADQLIASVYEWSEAKAKFTKNNITDMWRWMKAKGLLPIGFGKYIN